MKIFSEDIVWSIEVSIFLLILIYFSFRLILNKYRGNQKLWARLEYVWILVGFVGLLALVNSNRLIFHTSQVKFDKFFIEEYAERVLVSLNLRLPCAPFDETRITKIDNLSESQIAEICNWRSQALTEIVSLNNLNEIDPIPKILEENYVSRRYYIEQLKNSISGFNYSLNQAKQSKKWNFINDSFGFFVLICAFALRLIITSRKVSLIK